MSIGYTMLLAVRAEVEGTKAKAEANLEVLLNNPVGIGEHVDLVSEVHNLISTIVEAEDKLDVLSRKLDVYSAESGSDRIAKFYPNSNRSEFGESNPREQ
tara:strand:+ start:104 stop:403 length:300 start_codon:yes stop_codon:yes gene_type:complete